MLFAEVGGGFFDDDAAEGEDGDHVGDGHEPIEDVSDGPDGFDSHVGSDEDRNDVKHAEDPDRFHVAAGQVLDAALRIVVPAQNGREGEEDQAGHEHKGRHGGRKWESVLECISGDLYALQPRLLPRSRDDDGKSGQVADDDGVEESTRHADEPLADRLLGLRSRSSDRSRTKACLI